MRLYEIVGDDESIILDRLIKISLLLKLSVNIVDLNARYLLQSRYVDELNADKVNLLYWVTRSKQIAEIYYSIPAIYKT